MKLEGTDRIVESGMIFKTSICQKNRVDVHFCFPGFQFLAFRKWKSHMLSGSCCDATRPLTLTMTVLPIPAFHVVDGHRLCHCAGLTSSPDCRPWRAWPRDCHIYLYTRTNRRSNCILPFVLSFVFIGLVLGLGMRMWLPLGFELKGICR